MTGPQEQRRTCAWCDQPFRPGKRGKPQRYCTSLCRHRFETAARRYTLAIGYLWKGWMPSAAWIPGSWYWDKIGRTVDFWPFGWRQATDAQGRAYDIPEAVASSFGVKLKPQDIEENKNFRMFEIDKARRALSAEEARLNRQRSRNMISEGAFLEAMDAIDAKLDGLADQEDEILKAPAPARTRQ